MALIQYGPLVTNAIGSVSSVTFQENGSGQFVRVKKTTSKTSTPAKALITGSVSILSGLWKSVLTQAQRDAWTALAAANPRVGKLGGPLKLSGLAQFVACNQALD